MIGVDVPLDCLIIGVDVPLDWSGGERGKTVE
jgi:hypothetical protein